jgi:hypothetical protein
MQKEIDEKQPIPKQRTGTDTRRKIARERVLAQTKLRKHHGDLVTCERGQSTGISEKTVVRRPIEKHSSDLLS